MNFTEMTTIDRVLQDAHQAAVLAVAAAAAVIDEKGPCGFAWVTIDGRSPLATFCRRIHRAAINNDAERPVTPQVTADLRRRFGDRDEIRGWTFWKPGNYQGQRIEIHEAGARAFMLALGAHGISAQCGSRLD